MTFNDICLFDAQTHPSSACWYVHDFMLHGARFAFISIHKSVMWSRVKGNCRIFSAAAGSHNLKTVQQSCIRVKWCRSGVPIKSRWYQGLLRVPFPLANLSRVLLISNPLAFQPKWASMPQTPTYTYIYIYHIILYISYYIYHVIYIMLYIYIYIILYIYIIQKSPTTTIGVQTPSTFIFENSDNRYSTSPASLSGEVC